MHPKQNLSSRLSKTHLSFVLDLDAIIDVVPHAIQLMWTFCALEFFKVFKCIHIGFCSTKIKHTKEITSIKICFVVLRVLFPENHSWLAGFFSANAKSFLLWLCEQYPSSKRDMFQTQWVIEVLTPSFMLDVIFFNADFVFYCCPVPQKVAIVSNKNIYIVKTWKTGWTSSFVGSYLQLGRVWMSPGAVRSGLNINFEKSIFVRKSASNNQFFMSILRIDVILRVCMNLWIPQLSCKFCREPMFGINSFQRCWIL